MRALFIFSFCILLNFAFFIMYASTSCANVPHFSEVQLEQKVGTLLPLTLHFENEFGNKRQLREYFGKVPIILNFVYYRCPNLCSLVLNGLAQTLRKIPEKLGTDYHVISISFDPSDTSTQALAKKRIYLAQLGKALARTHETSNWAFLTGKISEVQTLAKAAGFHYQLDPFSKEYSHPSGIIIVRPDGVISKYFLGIQYDPNELHRALHPHQKQQLSILSKSSGRNSTQNSIEAILLYCFHYDPKMSRNGPLIMNLIRLTSLGGLALLLFFFYRLSKEKQPEESS